MELWIFRNRRKSSATGEELFRLGLDVFLNIWEDRIKVGESQPYLEKTLSPGEIRIHDGGKLVVGTSSNCLEMKLSRNTNGGKMIPSADFLNGYEIRGGTILDFQKSEALVS